ncbi:MAG: methyltransferase [Coprobacillus sp.]
MKKILDVCCGSRMFYFDKNNENVQYNDIRTLEETLCDGRELVIDPETKWDFTNLPCEENQYKLVIFDPPHLKTIGENSWMAKKYGKLPYEWEMFIKRGFDECMRVLEPFGILIFKWNETDITQNELFDCIGKKPLLGNKGIGNKTHWYIFIKEEKQ